MSLFRELSRRNVFRVAAAYAVVTWLLLQVVDVLSPILELPGWVPRAILLVLLIGFPIAVILAWAFELTPEGIKREEDVDRSRSITGQTGRRLNRLIIGGLLLVIVLLVVERTMFATRESEAPTQIEKSVAVLPFADLSEKRDQAWFAEGLAEEILNALAKTPDLLVSARTSSFAYKDSDKPVQVIAKELGVAHVLEGSVRRVGDRLRVTAQLIRADDGFHVWSENYDRDTDDVIAIQEDLAVSIARALETTMDPQTLEQMLQAGTRSVAAYEHYLEGLAVLGHWFDTVETAYQWQAYDAFERARKIDPGFSDAHAQAADIWADQVSISVQGVGKELPPLEDMMAKFRERIQMAIGTAPNPVDRSRYEAQLARVEMRLRDAARLYKLVLEQRPSDADVMDELADVAVYLSDATLLREVTEHAYQYWEKGATYATNYISSAYRIGGSVPNRDEFVERVMQVVQRYPTPGMAYQAHRTLLWMGEVNKARTMLTLMEVVEGKEIVLARQACADGRRAEAESAFGMIDPDMSDFDRASVEWHLFMLLGREDEAVAVLKPYETLASPLTLGAYLTYPQFDPEPFPMVMDILEREGVKRPPPVKLPFTCPPEGGNAKSVAVLPFANLSSDSEQGYFADGLAEEILNSLAQLPELLVTARTSSFYFKDKDVPIDEVAERLGVANILEGSVRRSGNSIRITAQLIRAADGFHLWSQTYDATLDDVFEVQDDIAEKVVSALDILLDDKKRSLMERAGVDNPEAYALFARGFELHRLGHTELPQIPTLVDARGYFERATQLAPELWAAYFTSADLQSHIMLREAFGEPVTEIDPGLVEGVQNEHARLLRLASRYAPNEAARDYVDLTRRLFSEDWTGLGRLSQGVFDHTQACGYEQWTHLLGANFGNAQKAYEFYVRGTRCNAVDESQWTQAGYAAIYAGRPELALIAAEQGISKAESISDLETLRVIALVAKGRFAEARAARASLSSEDISVVWADALVAGAEGESEEMEKLRERSGEVMTDRSVFVPLQLAAWSGDLDAANAFAAEMDARPFGPTALLIGTYFCFCGAPFNIESAPNFKVRFEATGLDWPPASPIDFPLKDW